MHSLVSDCAALTHSRTLAHAHEVRHIHTQTHSRAHTHIHKLTCSLSLTHTLMCTRTYSRRHEQEHSCPTRTSTVTHTHPTHPIHPRRVLLLLLLRQRRWSLHKYGLTPGVRGHASYDWRSRPFRCKWELEQETVIIFVFCSKP